MKLHTLHDERLVPTPLNGVFAFFERPENLALITPPGMGMRVITPTPIAMGPGAVFDYTLRVRGIPMRWTSLIAEYDPPHRFVDIQLKGPYAFWHHAHTFTEEPGGTRIRDTVTYALPFGPLGALAHRLVVQRDLHRIFAYRAEQITRRFNTHEPPATKPLATSDPSD